MENMVLMGDIKMPKEAISRQIADSVDLIIQVKRLRDGSRRVTNITEVIGMEGDVIVTQELMRYELEGEDAGGRGAIAGEAFVRRPFRMTEHLGAARELEHVSVFDVTPSRPPTIVRSPQVRPTSPGLDSEPRHGRPIRI